MISIGKLNPTKLFLNNVTIGLQIRRTFISRTFKPCNIPIRRPYVRIAPIRRSIDNSFIKALQQPSRYNSTSSTNTGGSTTENVKNGNPKNLMADIKKLLKLAKPEYHILVLAILCLVVTSSVSMSLPLFIGKIIDTAKELPKPDESLDSEDEKEDIKILGLSQSLFYISLGALFCIGAMANFGRTYLLRLTGERLVARLRSRLFLKILSQDSYFFDIGPTKLGMKTGDLISRLSSDTQIIAKTLSGNISDGLRSSISGVVGLSMMCYVSWKLTICMSLMFPPLIVMSMFYGRKIKTLSRRVQENLGELTKVSEENLNGLKTIQSFAKQKDVVHLFNREIRTIFGTSMREGILSGIYHGGNVFLGNATLIGLLFFGTKLISYGDLSVGDLSSFMMYAVYTGSSVFGLGNFYTELMKGIGAAERVFELTELKPKITTSLGKKIESLAGDVKFECIKFAYPSRDGIEIFKNFNITIRQGENICFVGPSGSGKSTISQLLLRFYDPNQGRILVNGHDIRELNLNFYRSNIGYVQQDSLLFSGTIRENILFGKEKASDEEILRAIQLSNAAGFISELPSGLDTKIGPSNSTQLSGGQRQRISLSRALIKKPKILILDEATSALDSISEEILMSNLVRLNREFGGTIISIAHRLSTIRNSDRIVVLNKTGEIVEDGNFKHLYSNPSSELNKLLNNIED